jgi:hypothetical protein
MGQEQEKMAVRAAASSALFHIRAYIANQYNYSFQDAVANFENAVAGWELSRTAAAASAAVSAALIAMEVAPMADPAGRPSPAFRQGAERLIAGLTKIVDATK